MRSPVIFQVLLAGTALAVPHYDPGHHLQHEKRAAARGMQAIPEMVSEAPRLPITDEADVSDRRVSGGQPAGLCLWPS